MSAASAANAGAGERALNALEQLLHSQREAMVAGDLVALQGAHAKIHALLNNPSWQRDAAKGTSVNRLRNALRTAAVNAGLAARGEAQAARALATLGVGQAPGVYNAAGSMTRRSGPSRGYAA
jgi:hypothetical protein